MKSVTEIRSRLLTFLAGLTARDRRALTFGAMILVPVLIWVGAARPYLRALEMWTERLEIERGLLVRERSLLAEAPTIPPRIRAVSRTLEELDERFVAAPNQALAEAEVSALMEQLARESRVLLQEARSVALQARDGEAPGRLLPIRLSLRGESDFEGLLNFLNRLEQDPLLLRIVGISVDRVEGATAASGGNTAPDEVQPGTVTFVMIVEAYAPRDPFATNL